MDDFNIDSNFDDVIKNIKKSIKNLDLFIHEINKIIPKKMITLLKKMTPKDTGDTSKSWSVATKNNKGFIITNKRGNIIKFLLEGVKPHTIKSNESVLTIKLPGSILFARVVNHPGYDNKMDADKINKAISRLLDVEINKILDKLF